MALTGPNAQPNGGPAKGLQVGDDATQRQMRGDEKAAALLLALGPDFGRPILEELDEVEIRTL